jgi:hypothetical protein
MTKLSALTISRTRVKSPAPLAKITTLKMVQATDTTVTDLKPLLASTGLTFLAPPKLCPDAEVEAVKKAAPNVHISR